MILVDTKEHKGNKGDNTKILISHIRARGVAAESDNLPYGDFAFEGKGPEGPVFVGIERKAHHDMLNCIDDSRFSALQMNGKKNLYGVRILLLEGRWMPHYQTGVMLERWDDRTPWNYCKPAGKAVMYYKLYRYLMSVSLAGFIVNYSQDLQHTAYNVVEWYQYFQKRWEDHTAMQEKQILNMPCITGNSSLALRWAAEIDGVGVKKSQAAEKLFNRKAIRLANSDEQDWLRIPDIGPATAKKIVDEIHGVQR